MIGPRPVIVAPMPKALFLRSLKKVFMANENDDEHKPIPIAEKNFSSFFFLNNFAVQLTSDNTVGD